MSLTQIEYPLLQTTYRDKYTDVEMAYSISNHRNGVYPSESSGRGRTFQVNPGSHKRVLNFALATDRASRVIFPLAFFIFNVVYWVTYVWLWLAWSLPRCQSNSSITVTSQSALWRHKSPAPGLFAQLFVQAHIKENTKASHRWPLWWGIRRWQVDSPHKGH